MFTSKFQSFEVLPSLTSDNLWPLPKQQNSFPDYNTSTFKVRKVSMLPTLIYPVYKVLTSSDLIWPLTSTKNNSVLSLNMINPFTKYEKCPSFPSWAIMSTSNSQGFEVLLSMISNNLWPLPKGIWFLLLHKSAMEVLFFFLLPGFFFINQVIGSVFLPEPSSTSQSHSQHIYTPLTYNGHT